MADIKFYANINVDNSSKLIDHTVGSGLGFYGADYGVSVPIGKRQDTTWLTNSTGTESTHQLRLHNTKLDPLGTAPVGGSTTAMGKVAINGGTPIELDQLPNYLAPLNVRFSHTEAVRVQNCKLRIFDRNNINNHASGVRTYVYEVRHPSNSEAAGVPDLTHRGITDGNYWTEFDSADSDSPSDMKFTDSPGVSGLSSHSLDTDSSAWEDASLAPSPLQGSLHSSAQHDWYLALSAEPVTIGSKTDYGLYFTCEYL